VETVNSDQWLSVESHFDTLHELPREERAARLAAIEDEEVRGEVASLLEHSESEITITEVVGAMAAKADQREVRAQRIGPYRLVRRLGQGGQGAVFEAVRDDGSFEQRVAIKIVKWEVDTALSRIRFRHERQILAGLEHPNIARLLDGGETPDGAPYLVMEFVDGRPLTAATSDAAVWPLRRKLELFLRVADAVAFAHRNLIVHRDLKPANILVTKEGIPKLLDFGIAKLVNADSAGTITRFQAHTPDYASPEQVRGEAITTASDVYSLGVVLYEMLAGHKPYEIPTLSPVDIHKAVCTTTPAAPGISEDLDNILLMAMRKEPGRRYASVEQFAQDIQRALDFRPVLARKDSFGYRASRFMRRNMLALGAGAAVFIAVAGGAGVALREASIANERFQQVRRLAHSFVFDYDTDLAKVEGNTAVREKMVRTALEYLNNLSRNAGRDLDLQKELAAAYQKVGDAQGFPSRPNLGHTDQAITSYRKASEIHEQIVARDPSHRGVLGKFYLDFAILLSLSGDYAGAVRAGDLGLKSITEVAAARPDDKALQGELAHAWCTLGDLSEEADHNRDALERFRQCDTIAQKLLAESVSVASLSMAQGARERVGTAATSSAHFQEAIAAFDDDEKLLGRMLAMEPNNPRFLHSAALLGQFRSMVYYDDNRPNLNDPVTCLKYSRDYLEAVQKSRLRDPNDATAKLSYAIALFRLAFPLKESDPRAAVASARESVKVFDQLSASGKSFLVVSRKPRALRRLAEALMAGGQKKEARETAAEALAEERKVAARDPNDFQEQELLALFLITAAETADSAGDTMGAEALFAEADHVAGDMYRRNPSDFTAVIPLARARRELGEHWRKAGDETQARQWFERSAKLWAEFPDQGEFVKQQLARVSR
jgi:tRNA A-37 threonylcarbamoyl transferase component Bud32/tetratricopeptide (TPR) repeat protein